MSINLNLLTQSDTKLRTLEDAIKDADVFLGLSAKDVVSVRI